MTRKEKSLLVLKSIFSNDNIRYEGQYIREKIDGCLELVNPEVLLDHNAKLIYARIVEDLKRKGKIV